MKVEIISHTSDFFGTIAKAASVCYDSVPSLKIVKGCIKSGHHSVLEHSSFTFKIEGISRACSHQLVRHRIASYSQRSQRYCTENGSIDYVLPSTERKKFYIPFYEEEQEYYNFLIGEGEKPEDARMVLPNACPTTIFVTMNLRSLSHFMNERLCTRAQREIRNMALAMKTAILDSADFTEEEKEIFKMLLVPKCEANFDLHICPEQKSCGRSKTAKEIAKALAFFENYERERERERNGDFSLQGDKTRQYLRALGYDYYMPEEINLNPECQSAIVPLYNFIENIPPTYVYPTKDGKDSEKEG